MCMYVHILCVHIHIYRRQKRVSDLLELELQAFVSHLIQMSVAKLRSSAREANALKNPQQSGGHIHIWSKLQLLLYKQLP